MNIMSYLIATIINYLIAMISYICISCFQFVDNINIIVGEIQPINNKSLNKMNESKRLI